MTIEIPGYFVTHFFFSWKCVRSGGAMKKTADSALVTDHATGAPPSPPSPFGLGQWLCARARETERENPTVQEEQG